MSEKLLKSEGRFNVKVTNAQVKVIDENTGAFAVLLKCETPDGYFTWHELNFSNTVISSGKNAGKTVKQVSMETLEELGVEYGVPQNLKKAIEAGLEAQIVMGWDEYVDKATGEPKRVLRSKYINPLPKTISLDNFDFAKYLDKLDGKRVDDKNSKKEFVAKEEAEGGDNFVFEDGGKIPF